MSKFNNVFVAAIKDGLGSRVLSFEAAKPEKSKTENGPAYRQNVTVKLDSRNTLTVWLQFPAGVVGDVSSGADVVLKHVGDPTNIGNSNDNVASLPTNNLPIALQNAQEHSEDPEGDWWDMTSYEFDDSTNTSQISATTISEDKDEVLRWLRDVISQLRFVMDDRKLWVRQKDRLSLQTNLLEQMIYSVSVLREEEDKTQEDEQGLIRHVHGMVKDRLAVSPMFTRFSSEEKTEERIISNILSLRTRLVDSDSGEKLTIMTRSPFGSQKTKGVAVVGLATKDMASMQNFITSEDSAQKEVDEMVDVLESAGPRLEELQPTFEEAFGEFQTVLNMAGKLGAGFGTVGSQKLIVRPTSDKQIEAYSLFHLISDNVKRSSIKIINHVDDGWKLQIMLSAIEDPEPTDSEIRADRLIKQLGYNQHTASSVSNPHSPEDIVRVAREEAEKLIEVANRIDTSLA